MAAAVALALVPGEVAEVTTIFGRASVACRFALEGEGVKFVSGVEGVWIAGMGAVESEFGGVPLALLVGTDDADDASFLAVPDERGAGLRCVTKRWTI